MNQFPHAAAVYAAQEEFLEQILSHGLNHWVWIRIDRMFQSHHFA